MSTFAEAAAKRESTVLARAALAGFVVKRHESEEGRLRYSVMSARSNWPPRWVVSLDAVEAFLRRATGVRG